MSDRPLISGRYHLDSPCAPFRIVDLTVFTAVFAVTVDTHKVITVTITVVNVTGITAGSAAKPDGIKEYHMAIDQVVIDKPVCLDYRPLGIQSTGYGTVMGLGIYDSKLILALKCTRNRTRRELAAISPVDDNTGNENLIGYIVFAESALCFYYSCEEFKLFIGKTYCPCLDFGAHIVTGLIVGILPHKIVLHEFFLSGRALYKVYYDVSKNRTVKRYQCAKGYKDCNNLFAQNRSPKQISLINISPL